MASSLIRTLGMQVPSPPRIVDYADYRVYLRARFLFEKATKKGFSYQYCALRMKTSRPYLRNVIERKAHISVDRVGAIGRLFHFSSFEKEYFTALVLKDLVGDVDLKEYFNDACAVLRQRYRAYGDEAAAGKGAILPSFKKWLPLFLEAAVGLRDFTPDMRALAERVSEPVSPAELGHAFEELVRTGRLERRGEGYVRKETSPADEPFDPARRSVSFVRALAFDLAGAQRAFALFAEFRDKIVAISNMAAPADRVWIVSCSAFALTKEPSPAAPGDL